MSIDVNRLKELASDPKHNAESIAEALGLGKAHNLYYALGKDAELKRVYDEGRKAAGKQTGGSSPQPRKSTKKSGAKRASSAAPPPQH